jgi:hypothetical protein
LRPGVFFCAKFVPAFTAGIFFERRTFVNLSLALVTATGMMALALQGTSSFRSHSETRSGSLHIDASIDMVFPMFTPEGEKAWAAGWNPEYVFPADGKTTQGMVFRTQHSGPKTWVMTLYDPQQHRAEYVNFGPDLVVQVLVNCRSEGGGTLAAVTYVHTGLTEKGNKTVDDFTSERMEKQMLHWKQAIGEAISRKTGR